MITVVVSPLLAERLAQAAGGSAIEDMEHSAVHHWLAKRKATLQPVFPGVQNPDMQTYFQLVSEKPFTSDDLAELRILPGIEAAYNKGMDSLP